MIVSRDAALLRHLFLSTLTKRAGRPLNIVDGTICALIVEVRCKQLLLGDAIRFALFLNLVQVDNHISGILNGTLGCFERNRHHRLVRLLR